MVVAWEFSANVQRKAEGNEGETFYFFEKYFVVNDSVFLFVFLNFPLVRRFGINTYDAVSCSEIIGCRSRQYNNFCVSMCQLIN